jgi:hypothetical protein
MPNHLQNLRERPFLIINSIFRPKRHVKTEKKGWAESNDNFDIFESPSVVDRVSSRHMTEATVIIDINNKRTLKNRFEAADDAEVADHYLTKYADQVNQAMDIWNRKSDKAITTA